jgi:hypothetical protein
MIFEIELNLDAVLEHFELHHIFGSDAGVVQLSLMVERFSKFAREISVLIGWSKIDEFVVISHQNFSLQLEAKLLRFRVSREV